MSAVFLKKGKEWHKKVKEGQKRAKFLNIWAKMYKCFKMKIITMTKDSNARFERFSRLECRKFSVLLIKY